MTSSCKSQFDEAPHLLLQGKLERDFRAGNGISQQIELAGALRKLDEDTLNISEWELKETVVLVRSHVRNLSPPRMSILKSVRAVKNRR
jgi:hypothetical protein